MKVVINFIVILITNVAEKQKKSSDFSYQCLLPKNTKYNP